MNSDPVRSLKGVGPALSETLGSLGIYTVMDLAFHLPYKYQDRRTATPLSSVEVNRECLVQGCITKTETQRNGLYVHFEDDSGLGAMCLRHYSRSMKFLFQPDRWIRVFGNMHRSGAFFHPEFEVFPEDPGAPPPCFIPVYRTRSKLRSERLRDLIGMALPETAFLPRVNIDGMTLENALRTMHEPDPEKDLEDVERARQRIAFDEMLAYIFLRQKVAKEQVIESTYALPSQQQLGGILLQNLGFELTSAQRRVAREVLDDLGKEKAMKRLLQGDVGSGKTVIAAFAAIRAAENHAQTAIMAPTELLAEQHHQQFSDWLSPLGVNVGLLTSKLSAANQRARLDQIKDGEEQVTVGTQSLIQRRVEFHKLGLVVIDEQHRFGVHQRMNLWQKGSSPHQLIMTATPIPRTLAMTMFAELDVSTIDELPAGRQKIETTVHSSRHRDEIIESVIRLVKRGGQVYWVCVAIDENEETDVQATEKVFAEFQKRMRGINIGYINGRMDVSQKNSTMSSFRDGKTQILVATTVIEVGIDVPTATLIVVENADRLGLAQLHQLRGRVGRGSAKSRCFLTYEPPLSETARTRLSAMRRTNDGFELAELDLATRGQGKMFGVEQSGADQFRFADNQMFVESYSVLNQRAEEISDTHPHLIEQILTTWNLRQSSEAAV